MHFQTSILVTALAALTAANPIETRQLLGGTGTSSSEFSRGGCRDILFAWARGSTEIGNMVRTTTFTHAPKTPLTPPGYRRWPPDLQRPEESIRRRQSRHRRRSLRRPGLDQRAPRRHRRHLQAHVPNDPQGHVGEVPGLGHRRRRLLTRRRREPPRDRGARRGRQGPDRWCCPLRRHTEAAGPQPDQELPRREGQDHLPAG
jgi:hypothetical protein